MFGERGIHGPLEDLLKPLLQGTLGYTGFSVHRPFIGWNIPYLSEAQRASVLQAWRERLFALHDERDYLPQPLLDDFDERLYRKGGAV
jgi:NAD(P)H dehydrogenase (quinone)